jgi:hypothetical protein
MRGFSGMRVIRIIGITETTTTEIIIKIIIMKNITHHSIVIMMEGISTSRDMKITTEGINIGMRGEEMIVIDRQTNTTKIKEVKIIACLLEVSK